jgi:hypothetical protein
MNIDIALDIRAGDIVYNTFMDELVVKSYSWKFNDKGKISEIIFQVTDSYGSVHTYAYADVYDKYMTWESDEEKSWANWAKDNKDFVLEFDHISTIKEIYKIGFANGFSHQKKLRAEEMLQK